MIVIISYLWALLYVVNGRYYVLFMVVIICCFCRFAVNPIHNFRSILSTLLIVSVGFIETMVTLTFEKILTSRVSQWSQTNPYRCVVPSHMHD